MNRERMKARGRNVRIDAGQFSEAGMPEINDFLRLQTSQNLMPEEYQLQRMLTEKLLPEEAAQQFHYNDDPGANPLHTMTIEDDVRRNEDKWKGLGPDAVEDTTMGRILHLMNANKEDDWQEPSGRNKDPDWTRRRGKK